MEKRNLKYSILNLLLLLPFSILHSELISKKKLLFHFDKIEVNGKVDVFLTSGKRTREAKIYADSEIIDSVVTHVSQKTLYIDANNSYKLSRRLPFIRLKAERTFPVEVIISIDKLSEIRLLGQSSLTTQKLVSKDLSLFTSSTGKMHLQNISVPQLTIIHNGPGDIVLKGNVSKLKAKITGNGSIFANELSVEHATLMHQGNGNAHIKPKKWMDARMYGNGNLFLHDNPSNMVIDKQGKGDVSDIIPDALPYYDLNSSSPTLEN